MKLSGRRENPQEPSIPERPKAPEVPAEDANLVMETDGDGNVRNPEVDHSLPTSNEVDGRLVWKTLLPDGRWVNGATGEEWTDADSVSLYGEDSIAKEPVVPTYTEAELAEAVALWEQVKKRSAKP